jgi:hypothetical protein
MWRSNFTFPHSFAAYICRQYLPPIFAAYICRLYLPPIFWTSAYILSKRQYFMHVRIFSASANILMIFAMSFCLIFVAANICVYFQYLFMHFYVRQYFWCNCFEA